jgi:hypothetical protein
MKNIAKILVLLISIFSSAFSFEKEYKSLSSLECILGEWISDGDTKSTKEIWIKTSPNTFEGTGTVFDQTTKTTTIVETLRLVMMSDEIFYIAKVSHNEYPIAFKLTSYENSTAVFENRTHDFPKKIVYKLTNKNKMTVTVGDGEKSFTVEFER